MEENKEDCEKKVLDLVIKYPKGLADSEFDKLLPLNQDQKTKVINALLMKRRILLLETNGGELGYKYQSEEKAEKYRELTASEIPIYQLLEEAGDHGLTNREIKEKTSINITRLNKILGSMESKGLIKLFKSIQGKKKKVYMLSEIEPSMEITGGIWYSGLEFNKKLIDALSEKCFAFIKKKEVATREEITLHVRKLGMLPGNIKEEEVQSILNTLLFDDKIELVTNHIERMEEAQASGNKKVFQKAYKVKKRYEPEIALLSVPCTFCPVIKECYPDGVISPSTCLYFKEWLDRSKA